MEKLFLILSLLTWAILGVAFWFGIPQAREFQERTGERSWLLAIMAFRRLP